MQNILKSKIFIGVILAMAATTAAVIIAVNAGHSDSGPDLQSQLDLGKKYTSELDYENAIIAYEEALEIDPYCLDAYLGLSDAYLALGQQDKATEIMERAKSMIPDNVEVYVSLAQLYASQDQINLAVSTLEEGIRATGSDRLRDMLEGYQTSEMAADQTESGSEVRTAQAEQPDTDTPDMDAQDEEEPAIMIGLRQDDRQRNLTPVLTIMQEDEEPVEIPLIAPAVLHEDIGDDSSYNGSGSSTENSGNASDSGNSGNNSGSGEEELPVTPVLPIIPGTGINGKVYGLDGQAIDGVAIMVYPAQSQEPIVTSTDSLGNYIQGLSEGAYRLVLSKDGYAGFSDAVVVTNDALTNCSYIMLTTEESLQAASLKGIVISAVDTQNIEDASITLFNSFDDHSQGSRDTTTGSDGEFLIDDGLTAGYYTIVASKDGYSLYSHNEVVKPGENELQIYMSPELQAQDEIRIVLKWGERPADLDSHLICSGDDNYHVYFGDKDSGDGSASLDWDDTTSYGPETVTVTIKEGNSYIYAVHNYTNRGAAEGQSEAWNLANSQARVVVYTEQGTLFDGNVPNEQGTTWEVFRIENGRFIIANTVGFEEPRELADDYSLASADSMADEAPMALSQENDITSLQEPSNQDTVENEMAQEQEAEETGTGEEVESDENETEETAGTDEAGNGEDIGSDESGTGESTEGDSEAGHGTAAGE